MNTITQAAISAIKFNGYKIELSINQKNKPVARLYKFLTMGKNKGTYKLMQGYFFATDESREKWINETMSNIKANIESDQKNKAERKEAAANLTFKVGDVLYQSWGYDQTNIDFFEVVEVLPKSVKVRAIGQNMVEGSGGFMCERVTPDKGQYIGEAFTRPVKAYISGGQPHFSVANGRHHLSLYTHGDNGIYQSHYA